VTLDEGFFEALQAGLDVRDKDEIAAHFINPDLNDIGSSTSGLEGDESSIGSPLEQTGQAAVREDGRALEDEEDKKSDSVEYSMLQLVQQVRTYSDEEGNKFVNQFRKIRNIGKGTTGSVKLYECTNTQAQFAFKCINKRVLSRVRKYHCGIDGKMSVTTALEEIQREINILASIKPHDNICPLLQVLDGESAEKLYLVFPYFAGGPLMECNLETKRFSNKDSGGVFSLALAKVYCRDIARGIDHLHDHGFIHRDIKPENILLDCVSGRALVSDFGSAKFLEDFQEQGGGIVRDTAGTYSFFAPEMCKGTEEGYLGFPADVWALGVTFYAMVFGILPYTAPGPKQLFDLIASDETIYTLPEDSTDEEIQKSLQNKHLRCFLDCLLAKQPSDRVTIKCLLNNHVFWEQ